MTSLRVMGLVVVAFVSSLSAFAQNERTSANALTELSNDAPDSCPITKPTVYPFVPPEPYSDMKIRNGFWFGKPRLWTFLSTDGTWRHLPHYTSNDPTFRQKLFWWRQGYDWHTEPKPKLTVTGRRLDSLAPPLSADEANPGWQRKEQPFIVVGINIPTLGCWQIRGHYGDAEVSFVVWVAH